MLADEPRVVKAWVRGWDPGHYIRLMRWRDSGFAPGIVYDIGAHDGRWSEMCQSLLHPERCYLFEPQTTYQEMAQARQPREGANWKFIPVALGERCESSTFHVTRNQAASSLLEPLAGPEANIGGINSTGRQAVPVVTLDEFVAKENVPPPDLVKIDVQGFEGQVLNGGATVLPLAKRLIIEASLKPLYRDQQLLPSVLATLSSWGFELDDISEAYRQWPDVRQWQVDLWLTREQ